MLLYVYVIRNWGCETAHFGSSETSCRFKLAISAHQPDYMAPLYVSLSDKCITLYAIFTVYLARGTSVDPDHLVHPCHLNWIYTGYFLVTKI
jgi:hypothetical protein